MHLKLVFQNYVGYHLTLDEQLRKRLKVSFVSEIGALEKDFSQYLENNRFDFPLAEEVYLALL